MRRQLIFLGLIAVFLLPFAWSVAAPFVKALLLAIVLGVLLDPVYTRLSYKLHRPRLAAWIVTILTGVVVLGAAWTIGSALVNQISAAYASVAPPAPNGSPALNPLPPLAERVANALASHLPVDPAVVREQTAKVTNGAAAWVLRAVGTVVSHTTSALVTLVLVLLFLYQFLRHGREWVDKALASVPVDIETGTRLVQNVHSTIVGVVGGTLVAALSEGLLTGLAFAVAGVRSAAMLGLFCGIASIVPLVGCAVIWVPVAIFELVSGNYVRGVLLAVWCGLATIVVDDIVRPAVARGHIQLHTLAIALSIIGGTRAFGALGVIFGPLVISLLLAVLREFRTAVALDRAAPSGQPSTISI